ncbi:hypothetical protein M0R01_03855 [bacterium]|nr:hypothetical protein [bacterium]
MAKMGRGCYSINGYRFKYDPMNPKDGGKYIPTSQVQIKTLSSNIFQTWESSSGDELQIFEWDKMDSEMYAELRAFADSLLTDSTTTHTLTYHKLSDEQWTILIHEFSGSYAQGYNHYTNVTLSFYLVSQIIGS